jgi:hypothetical protein
MQALTKNEAQMRQLLFLEKKDGCLLRQKTHSQISQSETFLSLGLFDKTNLQVVHEMYY